MMEKQSDNAVLSSDILSRIHVSLWTLEADDGRPLRLYLDSAAKALLGAGSELSPEEVYQLWHSRIDTGSLRAITEAFEKMKAGEHAEMQYPWYCPDGRTIRIRSDGIRDSAYPGLRIVGSWQDISDLLHFDRSLFEQLRQKELELLKSRFLAEALAYVSDQNPDAEKFIRFISSRAIEILGCDQVIFQQSDGRKTVFSAPDLEPFEDDICADCPFELCRSSKKLSGSGIIIMEDCAKGYQGEFVHPKCPVKSLYMQRVYAGDLFIGWLKVHFIREHHTFTEDGNEIIRTLTAYFGLLLERIRHKKAEEERLAREIAEDAARRDREIIDILASEYSSVYYIDLKSGIFNLYSMNETAKAAFGELFRSRITYSEAYPLCVEQLVCPDDRAMMLKAGSVENIRRELADKKTFVTIYRDADNRYSEMKFVKVGGEYDEPVAVALGFADRDAQLREQQESQRYSELVNALSEKYDRIFYVNTDDDSYVYYVKDDTASRFQQKYGRDFFRSTARNITADAVSEDRQRLLNFMDKGHLLQKLESGAAYLSRYQILIGDVPTYFTMRAMRPSLTEPYIIVAIENIDRETRQREQEQAIQNRNYEIIKILASEYSSVYYIDLATDELDPYTMNDETETTFGSVFRSGITYSEAFRLYVDKLVFPEDKSMMLRSGAIGNIMKELRSKKTFLTTFRNSAGHYSEMKFVKVGNQEGTPTAVALGFADKDAELRAKQEEAQVLQRNIDIIEILASEYSSVYYIDMLTDELDPYTMNEQTESQVGEIFRSGIKYSEAFRLYVDKFVYPADKARMLKAGSVFHILDELSSKKTFLTQYRNSDGEYCEMKFVKVGDEENPESVALGFSNKDEEIRAEVARKEKQDRDHAVISGLSDDFGCVIYTAYDDSSEIHYRYEPLFEQYIPGWRDVTGFGRRLELLTETIMHPEDRKAFRESTRPEAVRAAIDRDGVYYINFRTLIDEKETYYQAKFARDELHPETNVIVGFHNVDAETKREMETLEQARTANKAKTDFLFNMSHDIRTPMNAIIGFTNMAIKHVDDRERVIDSLLKTQEAGELLLSLINDILDMSRIESGKITLNENETDVYASFDGIEATMQELAKAKNIDLHFSIQHISDRYVTCDVSRCMRVFVNIITNAIKYTPEGGRVRVSGEQLGREDGYGIYRYTFEDNGIGMSEEFQRRAFDEFARESSATVSGVQGTGLGLSVCRSFVTAMNGTITCQSRQGKGTTFAVTLPFRIRDEQVLANLLNCCRVSPEQEDVQEAELQGSRVLLVDDNELNREIAECILSEEGILVETADDGTSAVARLQEIGPDYYDFILMDIQMPTMDGYEATACIRRLYPGANIPIIALSANAFAEDRAESLRSGMNDHVAKPINIDELKTVMANHRRKRR